MILIKGMTFAVFSGGTLVCMRGNAMAEFFIGFQDWLRN